MEGSQAFKIRADFALFNNITKDRKTPSGEDTLIVIVSHIYPFAASRKRSKLLSCSF